MKINWDKILLIPKMEKEALIMARDLRRLDPPQPSIELVLGNLKSEARKLKTQQISDQEIKKTLSLRINHISSLSFLSPDDIDKLTSSLVKFAKF